MAVMSPTLCFGFREIRRRKEENVRETTRRDKDRPSAREIDGKRESEARGQSEKSKRERKGAREGERGRQIEKVFARLRTTMWQMNKENELVAWSQLIAILFIMVNLHVFYVIRFKLHFLAIRWKNKQKKTKNKVPFTHSQSPPMAIEE